jgi:hypothetical protein
MSSLKGRAYADPILSELPSFAAKQKTELVPSRHEPAWPGASQVRGISRNEDWPR